MSHISFGPKDLPTSSLHACLLAGIAPRPIAFVSTINRAGQVNLSPFSFFNIFGSNPPILIFSPARRVRDNTTKHTLDNLLEVPECTVNIVDFAMVEQMSLASTEYEQGVNEFIKAGLTPQAGHYVQGQGLLQSAPLVKESPLSLECKVQQIIPTGQAGGAGNLVIAEVIHIHLRMDILGDDQLPDPRKLDLVGRMGGEFYVRASGDALFEIPKPLREKGIGVDALPEALRLSPILSGNDLGRLGNIAQLPSPAQLDAVRQSSEWLQPPLEALAASSDYTPLVLQRHTYAKSLLAEGKSADALAYLLA